MMIQKQFKTENGNIAYWINNCPIQDYALVFLHGLTADHTLFEKQICIGHLLGAWHSGVLFTRE